jgi:hypothetical protein
MADDPITTGIETGGKLEKVGFVDFTVDLVKGVYEVIVNAAMDQLKAYADIVSQVSKTLNDYQADMIGSDESSELNDKVDSYVKDVLELTLGSGATDYSMTLEKAKSLEAHFGGITGEITSGTPPTTATKTIPEMITYQYSTGTPPTTTTKTLADIVAAPPINSTMFALTVSDLRIFVTAKLKASVKNSQDLLKTILKIGMQKVVVTSGEIMTRITFHVDAQKLSSTDTNKTSEKASGWGIGGNISGSSSILGTLTNRAISGALSGGYSSRSLNVCVVNEKTSSATNLAIDILGEVRILFRTETFPTIET